MNPEPGLYILLGVFVVLLLWFLGTYNGLVRIDDWEMQDDIQAAVEEIWPKITTETLRELSDYDGYQENFLNLFGFGLDGVDYDAEVEVDLPLPSQA